MTQFELLCRRTATNERTIEPFRLLETADFLHHVPDKHFRFPDDYDRAVEGCVSTAQPVGRLAEAPRNPSGRKLRYDSYVARTAVLT